MATDYAAILFGCYRKAEAADPDTYLGAVVAVLTCFPEHVVRAVCDPRGGLPAKSQFLPTIYEVSAACEARMAPLRAEDARLRRERANEADRPAPVSPEDSKRRSEVVAKWRAEQALKEAKNSAKAGIPTRLEDMDARQLHGEHKALVTQAIDAKLERLKESARQDAKDGSLKASDALLAKMGRLPQRSPEDDWAAPPGEPEEVPLPDEAPMDGEPVA